MGNTQGTLVQPADAVDFAAYAQQPWRSERSNELDRLGGARSDEACVQALWPCNPGPGMKPDSSSAA